MPYEVIVEENHDHDDHDIFHVETVRDNSVEHTEWWHCETCQDSFPKISVTIIGEP